MSVSLRASHEKTIQNIHAQEPVQKTFTLTNSNDKMKGLFWEKRRQQEELRDDDRDGKITVFKSFLS